MQEQFYSAIIFEKNVSTLLPHFVKTEARDFVMILSHAPQLSIIKTMSTQSLISLLIAWLAF